MGCDIHGPWVEVKGPDYNGKQIWHDAATVFPAGDRNYSMFEVLAGVRGDENKAVVAPRGYPADMGWQWKEHVFPIYYEGATADEMIAARDRRDRYEKGDLMAAWEYTDCHSASWLTADEVDQALEAYQREEGEVNEGWTLVSVILRYYEMRGQEARVGFCFDN